VKRKPYQEPIERGIIDEIWMRGWITGFELLKIGAWKSAKPVPLLTVNSEDLIESVTGSALDAISEFRHVDVTSEVVDWGRWVEAAATAIGRKPSSGLLRLSGVGFPTATAILAVVAPGAFPVMDKWAISEVFEVSPSEASRTKWHRSIRYGEFTQFLAGNAIEFDAATLNVHERDQILMNRAMQRWGK